MPSLNQTDPLEGGKIFAIGDIHGCSSHLRRLLNLLDIDPRMDTVIFTGDYIDRGADSPGVVDTILQLKRLVPRVICLKGNHEVLLLNYYLYRLDLEVFLYNGGGATINSYRLKEKMDPGKDDYCFTMPPEHVEFFQSLLPYFETDHYIFVHAGLKPGIPLLKQDPEDLVWIRDEFIFSPGNFEKTVVFGHTPFSRPYLNEDRIGIDTGAVYGGKLTCIELPSRKIYQAG